VSEFERLYVFFGVWVALAIVSGILFRRASVETKRRWAPRVTILTGFLFVGFTSWVMGSVKIIYVIAPVTALFVFISLKLVKFCSKCGAQYQSWGRSNNVRYCAKCGHDLREAESNLAPPNNALEQTRDG